MASNNHDEYCNLFPGDDECYCGNKTKKEMKIKEQALKDKEDKVIKLMTDLSTVTQLAVILHEYNIDKAYTWMITPNELFFGKKPYESVLLDPAPMIEFLETRLGRKPGAAF